MAITSTLLLCSALASGSAAGGPVQRTKRTVRPAATTSTPTPPTTTLVTMREPVENAYTMGMPKGWSNLTYLARLYDSTTIVDLSVSPNGSVVIWSGDPSLPGYTVPEAATETHYFIAERNKKFAIAPFQTAEQYFPEYTRRKFGRLPGFKLTGVQDDPASAKALMEKARSEYGMEMFATAANVEFQFASNGKTIRGLIMGITGGGMGTWNVSMSGIATTGSPRTYLSMSSAMGKTRKMNPEWQAAQQRKHDEAMARLQANGEQWRQASAQAHQSRMAAIKASGDASTKAFYDRMASGDVQHRSFLNYINDESTVTSPTGKAYQVDNSYDRYFMNTRTQKYIGGNSQMSIDDLRRLGLNPNDYVELKPRK